MVVLKAQGLACRRCGVMDKMVIGPDVTRKAEPADHEEIDELLNTAFGQSDEAELVHRLRADGDMWLELIKPWQGLIAGYAGLSRMQSPHGWACLAPVAVLPRLQNAAAAPDEAHRRHYAIGTRLVSEIALAIATIDHLHAKDRPDTIVVLGKPSFYERAGFSLSRAQKLSSPYPIKHTLIARRSDDVPVETLVYPPAFDVL